jgi:hypothetical protein
MIIYVDYFVFYNVFIVNMIKELLENQCFALCLAAFCIFALLGNELGRLSLLLALFVKANRIGLGSAIVKHMLSSKFQAFFIDC